MEVALGPGFHGWLGFEPEDKLQVERTVSTGVKAKTCRDQYGRIRDMLEEQGSGSRGGEGSGQGALM